MTSPDIQVARILSVGEAMEADQSRQYGTGIHRPTVETAASNLPPLRPTLPDR